jgi:hypothetical protein
MTTQNEHLFIEPETDPEKLQQKLRDAFDLMMQRVENGENAMPCSIPLVMSHDIFRRWLHGTNEEKATLIKRLIDDLQSTS